MADTLQKPLQWNSCHAKGTIPFGITDYKDGFGFNWTSVVDVDGKAEFQTDGAIGTPPCKYLAIDSGMYTGVHVVISIDAAGNILTGTDFTATDAGVDGSCLFNMIYRLYYAYPEPTAGSYIDIAPIWKSDGTLIVNLAEYLKSIFIIQPPIEGYDENMYNYFRVKIVAAADFEAFCVAESLTAQTVINNATEYVWDDASNLWYVINGCIPNLELNNDYTGLSDVLSDVAPIYQASGSIVSRIVNDRVYNIFI